MRSKIIGAALACCTAQGAQAHVVLAQPNALPGEKYVAHFKVGHGCSGSPTTAISVRIPSNVSAVQPQTADGWQIATVRADGRINLVTWKGSELAADKMGDFPIAMTLPDKAQVLSFPVTQTCKTGTVQWTQLPAGDTKLTTPAPLLTLAAAPASASGLSIVDGWFRALPAGLPAGGYFTLRNDSAKKMVLTGAQSPGCGLLMLHKSQTGSGMASMDMVSALDVPAKGNIVFAPNGYHLMCTDAKAAITPGGQVPVTLQFQDGAALTVDFAVRNAAGK